MTKRDIVEFVHDRLEMKGGFHTRRDVTQIVDDVFEVLKETLARGEELKVSGFGNFVVRDKRERPGRDPQTGEEIIIEARRVLTFRPSQKLKEVLNP